VRRLLVAVVVGASLAWLPAGSLDARQEVTSDTRLLAAATYVAIGFGAGGGFVSDADAVKSMDVTQEDRAALVAIRQQFEKWHRYTLTSFPERAELLIAVRTGRLGHAGGRAAVGGRPPGTGVKGLDAGGSSSPDDMLSVYSRTSAGNPRSLALVWRKAMPGGLSGSPAPLFDQFRLAVDAASKQRHPSQ
jgi:hypothetical protein